MWYANITLRPRSCQSLLPVSCKCRVTCRAPTHFIHFTRGENGQHEQDPGWSGVSSAARMLRSRSSGRITRAKQPFVAIVPDRETSHCGDFAGPSEHLAGRKKSSRLVVSRPCDGGRGWTATVACCSHDTGQITGKNSYLRHVRPGCARQEHKLLRLRPTRELPFLFPTLQTLPQTRLSLRKYHSLHLHHRPTPGQDTRTGSRNSSNRRHLALPEDSPPAQIATLPY